MVGQAWQSAKIRCASGNECSSLAERASGREPRRLDTIACRLSESLMDYRRSFSLLADPPRPWRPLLATATAALAIGGASAAAESHAFTSYSLIVAGVLAATWYSGLRFGLVALAFAMAFSWVFIADPRDELGIEPAAFFQLCIGMATAGGAALLLDYARRGWRAAEYGRARERALRADVTAREARFGKMLDELPVSIAYVDTERRYVFSNRGYGTWFADGLGRIEGRHLWDVLGDDAYERLCGYVDQALNGKRVSFEANVPYKHAGTRWVHADYVPDVAPDGAVRGFFKLIVDETQRKHSEAQARRSEKRYRSLAEATTSVVWVADAEAQIVEPQPEYERYTGQAWPEYRGTGFLIDGAPGRPGRSDGALAIGALGLARRSTFPPVSGMPARRSGTTATPCDPSQRGRRRDIGVDRHDTRRRGPLPVT